MPRDTFLPLKPAPGAWRNGSRYEATGRWYDVNLVRWTNGRMRPVGGWKRITPAPILGVPRGLHGWRANNMGRWLVAGSSEQLRVLSGSDIRDITPVGFALGRVNSIYGLGWGAGKFGMDAYGTQRSTSGIVLDASTWSFDNFGEIMIGCATGDGRIYEWSPAQYAVAGDDGKAKAITGAPVGVSYVFVTDDRAIVALGQDGNPRKVAWCSRENRNEWITSDLNTAGDFDLSTAGRLVSAVKWRNESLLFTDVDVHKMKNVGQPLVYGFEQVGENCGIVGPQAAISLTDRAVWMSTNGFWQYDGVSTQVGCEVQEHVFQDINMLQGSKITAGHNGEFSEAWWFYPSANSVENDRYVIWNYKEGWWSYGNLARTCWADKGVWTHVVAAAPNGHLYQHEDGWTDDGATRVGQVYAESGAIELGRGERTMDVQGLTPDDCEDEDCIAVSFNVRENPRSEPITFGPYHFTQPSGVCDDARFSGRQVEMRVEATRDGDFHLGTLRADVTLGSGR
jgi:hypothetical protein